MAATPVRILVIDDDAGQARLAQRTLERAGYAVEVAGDGDTGLALQATRAFDVLMVDHQMPGTGGSTCCGPWPPGVRCRPRSW